MNLLNNIYNDDRIVSFPHEVRSMSSPGEGMSLSPLLPCRSLHVEAKSRQPWNEEEIAYLKRLDRLIDRNVSNRMVAFLDYIKRDPSARHIFHPHHIESSTRLRGGYRQHVECNRRI